jgi:hypothetical protein
MIVRRLQNALLSSEAGRYETGCYEDSGAGAAVRPGLRKRVAEVSLQRCPVAAMHAMFDAHNVSMMTFVSSAMPAQKMGRTVACNTRRPNWRVENEGASCGCGIRRGHSV